MTLAASELEGALDRAGLGQQSSNAGKQLQEGGLEGICGHTACGEGGSGLGALGRALGPSGWHQNPGEATVTMGMAPHLRASGLQHSPESFGSLHVQPRTVP